MRRFLPRSGRSIRLEKINSALSPEEIFSFFSCLEGACFLNSSLETEEAGYSFIGLFPFFSIESRGAAMKLTFGSQGMQAMGNPLKVLASAQEAYKVKNDTPFPLIAGGMGFFSYETKNLIEHLPRPLIDDVGTPDIYFSFYRCILIFDRNSPGYFYAGLMDMPGIRGETPDEIISFIKKAIKGPLPEECSVLRSAKSGDSGIKTLPGSNFSKSSYVKAVQKVLEHIKEGDIYQACLSQRFTADWDSSGYGLYLGLNKRNPSPFSAYLKAGDISVVSASPELFMRRRGDVIETRPMKGTRPRGKTREDDAARKEELSKSAKDAAELLMIVDLERNDIGKIAVPGTVKVETARLIETHPTVFQAISVVKGTIRENAGNMDIIEAAFPGGSITGCPKIRAIEIINDIERYARGVYTGAIGYMSFHDTMDLNVAIRTMTLKGGRLYFGSGGGIVSDSDPEEEYEETLVKARALMEAASLRA